MDIDIDTQIEFDPSILFPETIKASMIQEGKMKKHPAGVYFQNMPTDVVSGLAAIPYKEAEKESFFKVDFLHLGLLSEFRSKKEIRSLLKLEPDWSILLNSSNYNELFQISRHYETVSKIRPTSIEELADCIALIRPGKNNIRYEYIKASKEERKKMRSLLYQKPQNGGYYFKKSHAHAYAMTVVLQMHIIGNK